MAAPPQSAATHFYMVLADFVDNFTCHDLQVS